MKIALIGSYPPPYGGISVHIQRMGLHLEATGIDHVIYDTSMELSKAKNVVPITNMKKWLPKYFFFAKEEVIHYHSPDWFLRAIFGLMSLWGKKTIISIHGESLGTSLKNASWFQKKFIVFALKQTSFIIADNPDIKKLVLSLGVPKERTAIIPAFLPPYTKEEDIDKIPQSVWNFIDSHDPVISANAFKIAFFNNHDLYGIDMCIDLCANLKQDHPNIGLVFCLPNINDYEYFKKLQHQIKQKNIESNILFITEPLPEVYPIWNKSDIFVRPTCTDGDAVSIREAMYFDIPVVTSDVIPRPDGVVLFDNRNIQDFIEKTRDILDNYEMYKNEAKRLDPGNGFNKILEIYNELAK